MKFHAEIAVSPTGEPRLDRVFNDDLLMSLEGRKYAEAQFPTIIHVLDYPRLREKFAVYERTANEARDRVRLLGFGTILSGAIALLAIALEPILPSTVWLRWLTLVCELGGLIGVLIAAGGLWLGPWKQQWLTSRLMTERLRQWHFQLLVRCIKEIETSCTSPEGKSHFEQKRDLWFQDFLHSYEGAQSDHIESLTTEPGEVGTWLHEPNESHPADESACLVSLFDAYERLRFDPQYRYAVWKVRTSTDQPFWQFLKWPAVRQMSNLSGAAASCFIAAGICSAVLVIIHAFDLWHKLAGDTGRIALYVRTGAIAIAIIGAALRTIQEGLAPDKEIERYTHYRSRILQLHDRFQHSADPKTRYHLMEEMELAVVEEMKGFLRTHYKTTFILT